jgi:outer membrane protein W
MKINANPFSLLFICITFFLAAGSESPAQELSLKGRSALEVNLGLWGGAKVSNTIGSTGIQSEAGTSGFSGSFGYSYWLKENLSLTLTAGVQSVQARSTVSVSNVAQYSSSVVPLLLGLRYYIADSGDNIRPFLSAAIGTYIGSEAAATVLSQNTHVETAAGGRIGGGIDFFLGSHFMLGVGVNYDFMQDFMETIGARKNYSGAEFALGAGFIF